MMLRPSKGCYDPKDLEGVLPVLDRCLYDGGLARSLSSHLSSSSVRLARYLPIPMVNRVHIQGLAAH